MLYSAVLHANRVVDFNVFTADHSCTISPPVPRITVQIPREQRLIDNGADYWRLHGKPLPLALRAVAQGVFGCPAAAAGVERDFCIADFFMARKRGSLDPAYLEMELFLRAQFDFIPNDVPKLTDAEAEEAIPDRFRKQDLLDEVRVLDVLVDDSSDEDDDDVLEWAEQASNGAATASGGAAVGAAGSTVGG